MGNKTARGSPDCPCIDSSVVASRFANCEYSETEQGFWHYPISDATRTGRCYPISYGSNYCSTYEDDLDPLCTSNYENVNDIPEYCGQQWCYVDPEKCKDSTELYYRSTIPAMSDQNVFYSYSTCGSTNDPWDSFTTSSHIQGKTLNVAFPLVWSPAHYKASNATEDGAEHYRDSDIPWQGWVVDYLDTVLSISNIGGFNYTYRSVGSSVAIPSEFTAAVADVRAGISQVAASALWITSERLAMTPFTTQTGSDKIALWVPAPMITDSGYAQKVLEPFDASLWYSLILSVLVVSALSLLFATPMSTRRTWWKQLQHEKWYGASFPTRIYLGFRMLCDAFMAYSTFFFGHTVEYDIRASYPAKILNFGYGFLILIAVAAYTANLAAFLTLAGVSSYIETVEMAIQSKIVLCAPVALKTDLETAWPDATFEFYVSQFVDMFDVLDSGACGVVLASSLDVGQSEDTMNGFCDRGFVTTKSVALETPIGFAASQDQVAGLSFWMEEAAKRGITFGSFERAARPTPRCSLEVPEVELDELVSLTPANFILPFCVLLVCAVLAVVLYVLQNRRERNRDNALAKEQGRLDVNNDLVMTLGKDGTTSWLQQLQQRSVMSVDSQPSTWQNQKLTSSVIAPDGTITPATITSSEDALDLSVEKRRSEMLESCLDLGAIDEEVSSSTVPTGPTHRTSSLISQSLGQAPQRQGSLKHVRLQRGFGAALSRRADNQSTRRPAMPRHESFMDMAALPADIDQLHTLIEMMQEIQSNQARLHADQIKLVDRIESHEPDKKQS